MYNITTLHSEPCREVFYSTLFFQYFNQLLSVFFINPNINFGGCLSFYFFRSVTCNVCKTFVYFNIFSAFNAADGNCIGGCHKNFSKFFLASLQSILCFYLLGNIINSYKKQLPAFIVYLPVTDFNIPYFHICEYMLSVKRNLFLIGCLLNSISELFFRESC